MQWTAYNDRIASRRALPLPHICQQLPKTRVASIRHSAEDMAPKCGLLASCRYLLLSVWLPLASSSQLRNLLLVLLETVP